MTVMVCSQDALLFAAPIRPDWILAGDPVARNAVLARSDDRLAMTLLWDCTAGLFRWVYDQDETIHIIEGGVTLTLPDGRIERVGPGDVVFFPAGTSAVWHVDAYVRKLAVFRETAPRPVALLVRLVAKLRSGLKSHPQPFAPAAPGLQAA